MANIHPTVLGMVTLSLFLAEFSWLTTPEIKIRVNERLLRRPSFSINGKWTPGKNPAKRLWTAGASCGESKGR